MRTIIAALLLMSITCSASYATDFGEARLGFIKGDVQIYTDDAQSWVPAAVNTPLNEEDRIWVPEGGRAEIQLRGGINIRLNQSTALDIIALENDDYQFNLGRGRVYVNNRQGGIDHIQIETPLTSISSYDNSLIMIDTENNGDTELSVLKSYSLVETGNGKTRVSAGQSLRLREDMSAEMSPLPSPDKWEKWNRARDRKQASAAESLRYLPDELDDSAPDLDEHGNWHFNVEFGYVWRPRLALSIGWAPYRDGRWVWKRGNYVWVSYEPWGWGPYHYGRWAYLNSVGWAWIPPRRNEVIWSPGYVAWVEYRDTVAWVPLAPGEIYYGYTVRRPGNVNVNASINARPGKQVYRNAGISNSVTIISKETFITGRKKPVAGKDNPFLHKEASTHAPAIKPAKETAAPLLKQIPREKRPPERIIRIEPKEIKKERKIRRDEDENVLRHEKPPGNLPLLNRTEPRRLPQPEKLETLHNKQDKPLKREQNRHSDRQAIPYKTAPTQQSVAPAESQTRKNPTEAKPGSPLKTWDKGKKQGKDEISEREILKQYKEERKEKREKRD